MLVTGDNMGQLLLLGLDGQKVCVDKVHNLNVKRLIIRLYFNCTRGIYIVF